MTTQTALGIDCYDTAICLVPPETCWPPVERLRALYDKTYRKWPPHINLVYPFVRPERLAEAVQRIQSEIKSHGEENTGIDIHLDSAGVFHQRHEKTLFLHDGRDDGSALPLHRLRNRILAAVAGRPIAEGSRQERRHLADRDSYTMHMTVAQTSGGGVPGREADADDTTAVPTDSLGHAHRYLRHKVELLPPVAWHADRLHILVRERMATKDRRDEGTGVSSRMRLWGVLSLTDGTLERLPTLQPFYDQLPFGGNKAALSADEDDQGAMETLDAVEDMDDDDDDDDDTEALESFDAVTFVPEEDEWMRCSGDDDLYDAQPDATGDTLSVATYNVLGEFTWPPSRARLPLLTRAILADDAAADVLVLQEVTDDFLSALLADYGVRSAYPFASHGPPDQEDMEPLPSLLNMVVLSRHPFSWSWLGFERAHKGALIARFGGNGPDDSRHRLVLATVHLTHGLTNGSVSSKRAQLSGLLRHLKRQYPASRAETVVVAGDLNIHTSAYAVEQAQRRKAISPHTAQYVTSGFHSLLSRYGFVDAWCVASKRGEDKHSGGHDDELYDGEEGATYNPFTNALAAWVIGNGPNDRPERFDRILVRKPAKAEDNSSQPPLSISRFNLFGFPDAKHGQATHDSVASDHWGIRCVLERSAEDDEDDLSSTISATPSKAAKDLVDAPSEKTEISPEVAALVVPVVAAKAPDGPLADPEAIDAALAALGALPSDEEAARRKEALDLLRAVLTEEAHPTATAATAARHLVLAPVGSYGLGVWTPASDMDCLCIGVISPVTFFALAGQRLRRRAASGIRLLRRVRALTGTMLELRVGDFRVDLQYCQATVVAETWPAALVLPPTHPLFDLPRQTLAKLKAARDLYCLRKAFPETTGEDAAPVVASLCTARTFRTAHRAIKTWARARGLYEARFGYLSGMQISLLLARVMKLMAHAATAPEEPAAPPPYTVADLLVTFFRHYATFDWRTQLAFDPFFHTQKDVYARTAREPLAILGYHRPQLNTAANASVPSVRVLADEFRRAGRLLEHGGLTWAAFLNGGGPEPTPAGALLAPGPAAFVRAYRSYVRIDVQYWGLSQSRGVAFVGWLESRCVLLLVDMARRLPELTARIWPARFVEAADGTGAAAHDADEATAHTEPDGETHQYQGCYLIGLDLPASLSREDRHAALAKLQEVLAHFEKQMTTGAPDHYDPQWQWLSVRVVRQAALAGGGSGGQLQLDQSDWGVYEAGEEEEEEDDDEDEDGDEDKEEDAEHAEGGAGADDQDDEAAAETKAKRKKDKKTKKTPMAVVHHPGRGGKFRSAHDVLTRLRWDPQLDVGEYVVGYEDRFLGARERAVAAWKTEQQDEEFIPQHRILYFRRADGAVVWDRRTRKDDLFGSGV